MIDFSRIPRSSSLGRLLRAPLRLLPQSMVLPIVQGSLRGMKWIAGSSTHGCWLGSYEAEKQRRFISMARMGDVVYDVGANVGFYTLLASRAVGASGSVIAAEPLPRNLVLLRRHLDLNGIRNVTIIPAAIGASNGEVHFHEADDPSMGSVMPDGNLAIPMVSIDSLAKEFPAPTIIKIDVEGGELDVLTGARETLKTASPAIFLATHGPVLHSRCCEFLREHGYTLRAVTGSVESADELIAERCR